MDTTDPAVKTSPVITQAANSGQPVQNPGKSPGSFNMKLPLVIVAVMTVIAAAGYFFIKNQNTAATPTPVVPTTSMSNGSSEITQQPTQNQSAAYTSLNTKKLNEFFPVAVQNFQISERKGYKALNLNIKEYKRPDEDRVAHIDNTYTARYAEVAGDVSTGFGLTVAKLPNKDEVQVLSDLVEADFAAPDQGFKKVDMPLNNVKYWAIYRDGATDDLIPAGEVSMIFPESLTYIKITVTRKYTADQLKNIVSDYLSSITGDAAQYIRIEEIEP